MIFDLHVHTSTHSGDSSLSTRELVQEARRIGLEGACLTEHGGTWDRFELERIASDSEGVLLVPAMEVDTDQGHVTVFGLDRFLSGISTLRELRRIADGTGAYLVLAHPFRYLFYKSSGNPNLLYKHPSHYPANVEEAMTHPALQMVDAIEVANAGNNTEENTFAWEVAKKLGKPMVGGSDAHSVHGLGACVTVFADPISSAEELLKALHQARFYPATGLNVGNLRPFDNGNGLNPLPRGFDGSGEQRP